MSSIFKAVFDDACPISSKQSVSLHLSAVSSVAIAAFSLTSIASLNCQVRTDTDLFASPSYSFLPIRPTFVL